MIDAAVFVEQLQRAGFGLFSGVPCSYLTPLINTVIGSPTVPYVGAANEGEAVAICCGAELGGTRGVAMFQNSGLGNAVSPLTSLTATFRLPVLLIVTWRGHPDGPPDEPQHKLMGQITTSLLDTMGIAWTMFPDGPEQVAPILRQACDHMDQQAAPFALVMRKGAVSSNPAGQVSNLPDGPTARPTTRGTAEADSINRDANPRLNPDDVLQTMQAAVRPTDAVLASTGFTGRALYALDDRPSQFYMVGSMGCISSLGLGLALAQPQRRVVVVDGDGAALMRMGALAAIGCQRPHNLIHLLLDNGVHDSTGGQATLSGNVDFTGVARSCGYPRAVTCTSLTQLQEELVTDRPELTLVHIRTRPRENRKLPRPTISPSEVATRLQLWLKQT